MFGRLLSRSASIFSAASFSPRALILLARWSATAGKVSNETAQRELVTVCTESAHDSDRGLGEHRPAPLWLARVDIGQVHFDERQRDSGERIPDRKARMRVRPGIHQCTVDPSPHRVNRLNDLALTVVLREGDFRAELRSGCG